MTFPVSAASVASRLRSPLEDVIGIYTEDNQQILKSVGVMKVAVKEPVQLMRHPIETGATKIDFRIIDSITLNLIVFLNNREYASLYQQFTQLRDNATLLTIQTKSAAYANQLIGDINHDEDGSVLDALILDVSLTQANFYTAQFGTLSPAEPKDFTTVDKGTINGAPATPEQTQKVSLIVQTFQGIFK